MNPVLVALTKNLRNVVLINKGSITMSDKKKETFISQAVERRASNNGRSEVNDFEMTDVIQNVDEHTTTDEEFQKEFTKAVFNLFGWKYWTHKELEEINPKDIILNDYRFTKND